MPLVHFNHSGAGITSPETHQTIIDHLQSERDHGPMEAGARVADRLTKSYDSAAHLLGCTPQEIAFGTGHGQLYADIIAAIPLAAGDKILVSRQEWTGNLLCLQQAATLSGATLSLMPADSSTAVDVAAISAVLTPEVRIVALTWIGASSALINPAAALGKAIRESGSPALFIIDASQAVGQLDVNVAEIGCDALVTCGRKYLRGPRGTALAYLSPRLTAQLVPRKIDNFSARWLAGDVQVANSARAVEVAEGAVALRLGLATAIDQALALGLGNIRKTLHARASALRDALASLPHVHLLDLGHEKAAFVTFTVDGFSCATVKQHLAGQGITLGVNGPEYTPYDLNMRGITELLRASVHLNTTDRDIAMLADALRTLAGNAADAQQE
ncbi:aminotransferase class V-fold PLP-dependent enzyme [Erwinia sp. AnSW2-5]|uniref:aminotransferase class V-fold PLP-dependent enzyme n=1 Tax=Erwinia sp. AnSW2-5 TaxID=3367692 RepID=UPI0038596E42